MSYNHNNGHQQMNHHGAQAIMRFPQGHVAPQQMVQQHPNGNHEGAKVLLKFPKAKPPKVVEKIVQGPTRIVKEPCCPKVIKQKKVIVKKESCCDKKPCKPILSGGCDSCCYGDSSLYPMCNYVGITGLNGPCDRPCLIWDEKYANPCAACIGCKQDCRQYPCNYAGNLGFGGVQVPFYGGLRDDQFNHHGRGRGCHDGNCSDDSFSGSGSSSGSESD